MKPLLLKSVVFGLVFYGLVYVTLEAAYAMAPRTISIR